MDFSLSPELVDYQRKIIEWGIAVARPKARQADMHHAIPADFIDILDSCPVALDRIDDSPNVRPLPSFVDGELIRNTAIIEALNYVDVWLFESMNKAIGHMVVKKIGTPDQIRKWYDPIIEPGGGAAALAMSEPGAGSDNGALATTARREGDQWILNGSKMYCSRGAEAEYIVVLATVDRALKHGGIRAFVVERGTPGLIITRANEKKLGLRSWITTAFTLEQCAVPLDHQLGWTGDEQADASKSLALALGSFNYTRPLTSIQALAIARASYDQACDWLLANKGEFSDRRWQAVKSELSQMAQAIQTARSLAYKVVWQQAQGQETRLEAAIAKCHGPVIAEKVIRRCMQLVGPAGASESMLLEKWYRDVRIFDIFEGTNQIMHNVIARSLMGNAARA